MPVVEKWSCVSEEMESVRTSLTPLIGSLDVLKNGVVFTMRDRNYFLRVICGEGFEEDVNKPAEVEFRFAKPHEGVTPLKTWDYIKESVAWALRTKAEEAVLLDAEQGIHLEGHDEDFEIMGQDGSLWLDDGVPDDAEHVLGVNIPRFNRDSSLEIYMTFDGDEPEKVYLLEDLVWHKKVLFWRFWVAEQERR